MIIIDAKKSNDNNYEYTTRYRKQSISIVIRLLGCLLSISDLQNSTSGKHAYHIALQTTKLFTSGKVCIKLCMLAFLAASIISLISTSLELSPYAILSAIEASKRIGSCETKPN